MDEVTPHRLCDYCENFVKQADCLNKGVGELLPSGYDRDTHPYHVINRHKTRPSLEHIIKAGQKGCHLCTIFIGLMVEDTSNVRLDNVKIRDVCNNWFIPSSLCIPIPTAPGPPLTLYYTMVVHIVMKMTLTSCLRFGISPQGES
jgi:hypothetical protein